MSRTGRSRRWLPGQGLGSGPKRPKAAFGASEATKAALGTASLVTPTSVVPPVSRTRASRPARVGKDWLKGTLLASGAAKGTFLTSDALRVPFQYTATSGTEPDAPKVPVGHTQLT